MRKDLFLFDGEPVTVTYTEETLRNGDTIPTVYDRYRISILLSDGMHAVVRDQLIYAEANCILFFRPEEWHFGRVLRTGRHAYLDLYLPLSLSQWFHCLPALDFLTDRSPQRINCITFDTAHQMQIKRLCAEAVTVLSCEDAKGEVRLFSMILQILLLCSDHYESAKAVPKSSTAPPILQNILQFLSENYTKTISLPLLAQRAHCSAVYLSRAFKAHTGMTVWQYVTHLRIAHAQRLLREGTSVTEACFACGFNDCSNFIQKFKRITKKTPKQFQAQELHEKNAL